MRKVVHLLALAAVCGNLTACLPGNAALRDMGRAHAAAIAPDAGWEEIPE